AGLVVTGFSDLIGMRTALAVASVTYAVAAFSVLSLPVTTFAIVPFRPLRNRSSNQWCDPFVKLMIAFSTCWNSQRHKAGDAMLREIKDKLGFDLIELGHGIRISLMPGIQKMFDAGKVRFSSLHNFCPLPVEVMAASPDCYKFSAAHPDERERAIKQ